MPKKELSKVITPLAIALLLSAGCVTHPDAKKKFHYACSDDYQFSVVYSRTGGSVEFEDADQKLDLDQVEAASGSRYSDGNFVFWSKGLSALIEQDGAVIHKDCTGDNNI